MSESKDIASVEEQLARLQERFLARPKRSNSFAVYDESNDDCGTMLDLLHALAQDEYGFDMIAHLERQRAFSERAFGPGMRTDGISDHIRKELNEVAKAPTDLEEWIDVVMLALDGAWRCGAEPRAIVETLAAKLEKNERRTWPDWRTAPHGKAIEHDRTLDTAIDLARGAGNE